jgi:prepilin-type N-terminal cleavage/methylation domain-containing protein
MEKGFSLIEVLIAMLVTTILMGAVFALLDNGQKDFVRESEISAMNQSTRVGLSMISRDLLRAGMETPPVFAVLPDDGDGINPDMLTIVYVDDEIPISRPLPCESNSEMGRGSGPCNTIDRSAVLYIDPESFIPPQTHPEQAYHRYQVLFALETSDCNGDGQMGIYPFEVSLDPAINSAGGGETLQVVHNPGQQQHEINPPGGFNRQISPDCAIIGSFSVVQYRINPLPPTPNPVLERRVVGGPWNAVSNNIENLQIQYGVGTTNINEFADQPVQALFGDPETWVTRVRVTITGRTERKNLAGSSTGTFADGDIYIRKTFSTVSALRNQISQIGVWQLQNPPLEN